MRLFSPTRALHLAVLCAGLLSCTKQAATAPPSVSEPENLADYDPQVVELIESQIGLVRALPLDVVRRRNFALALEANSLWSDSVAAWETVMQMEPDDVNYRYHHAYCVDKTGETSRALELMQGIVNDRPSFPAAQFHLGMLLLDLGRFEEARQAFRVADAQTSKHPAPAAAIAEVEFNIENYEAAEEAARRSIEIASDYRPAHFALGKILRATGRVEEAEQELNRGMEAVVTYLPTPLTNVRTDLERGYTKDMNDAGKMLESGRPDLAVALLEGVVERHPGDASASINLGVAYTHFGRPDKAKATLSTVIEQDPENFGAYINLAAAEIDLGELIEAMAHVNKAIEFAPDVGRAYLVKAQVFTTMARHQDAYNALLKAQTLDTTDAQIQAKLGNAAWKLRKDEAALQHFRSAVALNSEDQMSYLNIAKLCIVLDRPAEANDAYQQARELDPNSPLIKDFEGWWSRVKKDSEN
ncbi:MAG: tetratricopeptide repeat protein [Planctomycetes bacterium]|nr:tetratricopeptide repeat protein [Planctomycetota bacterium]MCB9902811.1 tetratricopeptide repeat protein [Planctomycetota bacterium]